MRDGYMPPTTPLHHHHLRNHFSSIDNGLNTFVRLLFCGKQSKNCVTLLCNYPSFVCLDPIYVLRHAGSKSDLLKTKPEKVGLRMEKQQLVFNNCEIPVHTSFVTASSLVVEDLEPLPADITPERQKQEVGVHFLLLSQF